ncbi:hypothetical protein DEO72_LG8g2593 [Vigna unguiculata]|uniref:Uncharacterized protein n=1 Tax=Vigna unguiculata TaxID=3917 RepID=A0A4D6MXF4_VIGUN|nr:hypothetical protein DEO72_LG8g2593 [Vigna unguiculata]
MRPTTSLIGENVLRSLENDLQMSIVRWNRRENAAEDLYLASNTQISLVKRQSEKPTEKMSSNMDLTTNMEGVKQEGTHVRAVMETLTDSENRNAI